MKAHIRSLEAERNELSAKLKGRKRDTPRADSVTNEVYEEPIELEFENLLHKIRRREVQRPSNTNDRTTQTSPTQYTDVGDEMEVSSADTKTNRNAKVPTPRLDPTSARSNVSVEEYEELEKHCAQLRNEKKEMLSEMANHATVSSCLY